MTSNLLKNFIEQERMPWLVAVFYNLFSSKMLEPLYQHIVRTLPLKDGGFLIDIGTGPGQLAQLFARKYPGMQIVGIDISKKMIKLSRKNKKNLENLDFELMDAKNLKFKKESVDFVISTLTLHHWQDPLKVLNEIYRVLKPGGKSWIYDAYHDVSQEEVKDNLKGFLGIKPPASLLKKLFIWHGFSKKDYEHYVKNIIKKSSFKEAFFTKEKILMKIEMQKNA